MTKDEEKKSQASAVFELYNELISVTQGMAQKVTDPLLLIFAHGECIKIILESAAEAVSKELAISAVDELHKYLLSEIAPDKNGGKND